MSKITEAAKMDWNINTLIEFIDKEKIDFNHPVQRGATWNSKKDSRLIRSILLGRPISIFYFNKINKHFECLEGKQRSTAIYDFVKGKYKLHASLNSIIDENGEEISIAKHKFETLSELMQNRILRYGLIVYTFENMSTDDKVEFFTDINSGKPVTLADIARIKVLSRDIFMSLIEHPAIQIGVSVKDKRRFADEDIVKNIWCLCYNETPSLLQKDTSPILQTTEVIEVQKQNMINILDYIEKLFIAVDKDKKMRYKLKKTTHFIMLGYMAHKAITLGITNEDFIDKAIGLFTTTDKSTTISDAYNLASISGSARPENVRIRMNVIDDVLSDKLNVDIPKQETMFAK